MLARRSAGRPGCAFKASAENSAQGNVAFLARFNAGWISHQHQVGRSSGGTFL